MFAPTFAALLVAHEVADHWLQTKHQACAKGRPGWAGRRACLGHIASYTAAQVVTLAAVSRASGCQLRPGRVAAALAVSAATHYFADRREPLRRLAEATGRGEFYQLGQPRDGRDDNPSLGTGAYALDQSWHIGWLGVAALVASWSGRPRR
jgi:hypothetical protein